MTYLDANATQPLRPEAREAVVAALAMTGNPSSVHRAGRAVRRVTEDAREAIAHLLGCRPANLVFTSGATEANAIALHALGSGRRAIVSAIEHDAVLAAAPGAQMLPVGRDGVVCLDALEAALAQGAPAIVCLMLANNETGVVQPVRQAAVICRRFSAVLHVDAVQAAGRMAIDLQAIGCHSMAVSSHKVGGPSGAGALLLSDDAPFAAPLIGGGGQERGRRGGTLATAAIAGFAAALAASRTDDRDSLAVLRDRIEAAALASGAVVCGGSANRLANTACLALPGVRADSQVIALDLAGIAVSAGAACSSGKVSASHVLRAMGLGDLAGCAIRVSLPWNATDADVQAFVDAYPAMARRLRA